MNEIVLYTPKSLKCLANDVVQKLLSGPFHPSAKSEKMQSCRKMNQVKQISWPKDNTHCFGSYLRLLTREDYCSSLIDALDNLDPYLMNVNIIKLFHLIASKKSVRHL